MFLVKIQNTEDQREWRGQFETQEEAQAWLDKQLLKEGRLQERQAQDVDAEGRPKFDENEEPVMITLPAQASHSITDLSQDVDWVNQQTVSNRAKEYPSIQEIIHVMMDHGVDSPEYQALMDQRAAVKAKYPKS